MRFGVLAACFLFATSALADVKKPALHVLSFDWDGDAEPHAEALFRALGVRVRDSAAYSLGESQQAASSLATVAGCKDGIIRAECESAVHARLKSDRFLWGTVTRAKNAKTVTAEVHLSQKGFPEVVVRETYSVRLVDTYDPVLQEIAEKILRALVEAPEAKGLLRVKTGKYECPLAIDGAPKGETNRGIFEQAMAPGMHAVETLAPCEPLITKLFVPAGGVSLVDFGRGTEPDTKDANAWRKPLALGLMGVGAAVGIGLGGVVFGAGYFSNRAKAEDAWVNEAFNVPELDCSDVLQNAKATASCKYIANAERDGNWALVSTGVGLAMVGAGLYLFFTAPKEGAVASSRVRLSPLFGSLNGASVGGQF